MIKKWLNGLILWIKVTLVIKKQEIIPQKDEIIASTGSDILETAKVVDILSGGIHKEDQFFKRENNLIQEFVGDPPIVYESDMRTIRKQSQYGYVGDNAINEPEELLKDDIDLLQDKLEPGQTLARPVEFMLNTTDYGTKADNFEGRWNRIKQLAREEDSDVDGVIAE